MDASGAVLPTFTSLLIQSPVCFVWLVGFVLALVFWRRHAWVSLLTVIALTVLAVETLVNTWLNMWLPVMLSQGAMDTSQIGLIMTVKSIVTSIIVVVAWGMIIAAIFGGRKAATRIGTQPSDRVITDSPAPVSANQK